MISFVYQALTKDLEKTEVKKWLAQILEILMAERAKDQRKSEFDQLESLVEKHEHLVPTVQKTQIMVDLYWKCYAYGDELKPHIEFLDGIMMSSTREIAPSCIENVEELIERQEKSMVQLDAKRNVVLDLIDKGKKILENPDKPTFLEKHVELLVNGWDDTKEKARQRLELLLDTKDAWRGYADNTESILNEIDKGHLEMTKIKKHFNLQEAFSDLATRQEIFERTKTYIEDLFHQLNKNVKVMSLTLPADKKKIIDKELKAVEEKLIVIQQFEDKVKTVENFCISLKRFNGSLQSINSWMSEATAELNDIRESSDQMTPEDRVARTMDLQEDVADKLEIIRNCAENELKLLPQGKFCQTPYPKQIQQINLDLVFYPQIKSYISSIIFLYFTFRQ